MLTLLGSLLGFIGSAFPDILRCFQDKRDHAHELALFRLQIKMTQLGQMHHRDTAEIQMDTREIEAIYQHARPSGIQWIDALSGSVRPIITYTFFLLYAAVKVSQGYVILAVADQMNLAQALLRIWHEEDQALFAAVMAFWFGQRALRKGRQGRL